MTAGYSGTPLAKKLSLRAGQRAWFEGMPESVRVEIAPDAVRIGMRVKFRIHPASGEQPAYPVFTRVEG